MKEKRQSNFELMRIVSMLFIVLWHFILHGKIWENSTGNMKILCTIISALFMVHVNSFVLLTGYFSYNKEFKLSKIFKINNSRLFYNIIFVIIFVYFTGFADYSKLYYFKQISPIPRFWDHWFLIDYMLLYLVSPALNFIINKGSRSIHKKIIIALLVLNVLAYATYNEFYFINKGFSLVTFILLYFIGSYLHKYPVDKTRLFSGYSKRKIMFTCTLICIVMALVNATIYLYSYPYLESKHEFIQYFSYMLSDGFNSYANPCVLIGSVCYFIFFSYISFSNKLVNSFSKYILGVYLITEVDFFRPYLYKVLGFNLDSYTYKHLLIALGYSIVIMIVCVLIEYLRTLLFKFFYNRKIASRIRNKIQLLLNNTGLNVRW